MLQFDHSKFKKGTLHWKRT